MTKMHRVYFTFMGACWSADDATFDLLQRSIEREGAVPNLSTYKTTDQQGRRYKLRQLKRVPAGRTALPLVDHNA